MTTIVAVRKKGRTCIVSDSLTVYGGRKEVSGRLIVPSQKLLFWENAIIGFSGDSAWSHVFLDFLRSQKKGALPVTSQEILASFSTLWRSFRSTYFLKSSYDEDDHFSSICRIVIATQKELFKLTVEGAVIGNENVVAIGGGYPFAYGAVRAIDSCHENPYEIAMAGVRAASAWDPDTSGPFSGWHISEAGEFAEFTMAK